MLEQEKFLCDKWLGSGIHRAVYVYSLDNKKVIKIALGEDGRKTNLIEAKIWEEIKETPFAKWFAPVCHVSEAGLMLIMDRADTDRKYDFPAMVPHFFTDLKFNNYGFMGSQLVCLDYGSTIITQGFTDKLKEANFWE